MMKKSQRQKLLLIQVRMMRMMMMRRRRRRRRTRRTRTRRILKPMLFSDCSPLHFLLPEHPHPDSHHICNTRVQVQVKPTAIENEDGQCVDNRSEQT